MTRPNVLWICSDQQRWDTLGAYGNPYVRTPNLDALAGEGVLFERAYSTSPLCTPSRANFLTGRYPRTCRTRQNGQCIPEDEVLVTRMLAEAGYTCGLSGKLHLSACNPKACGAVERRIRDGYSEFHWSHHPSDDWPGNEYTHWLARKGRTFQRRPIEDCPSVQIGPPAEDHQTTWCAEKAIEYIRDPARAEGPWLFSVNMFDPHHPFDPPEEFLAPYLDRLAEIPLPNYVEGELAGKPTWQAVDHEGAYGRHAGFRWEGLSQRDHRMVRAAYWAMCDLIDREVGRMLKALDQTHQRDNTIVIFQSDHGEMLGDHGIYLKGPFFYEPAVHVPLIVSCPSRIPGRRRASGLVELTDLPQTLLDAAGLEHHPGMQGRSLWPALTDAANDLSRHRPDVYCEFLNAHAVYDDRVMATMVFDGRHKVVAFHDGSGGELYDLQTDPNETHNLWDQPDSLALKAEMLHRLCDRIALTVDPLGPRLAPW